MIRDYSGIDKLLVIESETMQYDKGTSGVTIGNTMYVSCIYPIIFMCGGTTDDNIDKCCEHALRKLNKFIQNL